MARASTTGGLPAPAAFLAIIATARHLIATEYRKNHPNLSFELEPMLFEIFNFSRLVHATIGPLLIAGPGTTKLRRLMASMSIQDCQRREGAARDVN